MFGERNHFEAQIDLVFKKRVEMGGCFPEGGGGVVRGVGTGRSDA